MSTVSLLTGIGIAAMTAQASPASAQGACQGRQGASALVQYCEAIPDSDGSSKPRGQASGNSRGTSSSTLRELAAGGTDGERLAGLLARSDSSSKSSARPTPKPTATTASSDAAASSSTAAPSVSNPPEPDGSPLRAAREAAAAGPTAGEGVTWALLGMSTLGALSAVLIRRKPRERDR
ncbi:MAG: hypothetical protein QM679_01115 [Patulibacter sp.]